MKKIIIFILLMSSVKLNALEITDLRVSIGAVFVYVTVALESLNESKTIRCTVFSNDKPILQKTQFINGVGTLEIRNPASIQEDLSATCSEVR